MIVDLPIYLSGFLAKGGFTAEAPSSQRSEYFLDNNSLLRALRGPEKKLNYRDLD